MKKNFKRVHARAPLRLGIAGGGTDVSPFCDNYGGYVLNATIDKYAYVVIEETDNDCLNFNSDFGGNSHKIEFYSDLKNIPRGCILHYAVYRYMIDNFNNNKDVPIDVFTFVDAHPGSGLGSSSTLVVALIKGFVEFLNLPSDDYQIAQIAYKIERVICNMSGGKQDQYAAAFGGINFIEFYSDDKVIVNPLRVKNWIICEFESSILTYFTGVSRNSSEIIDSQTANVVKDNQKVIDALLQIKNEAITTKEYLLKGDFRGIVRSMQLGWENKKNTSNLISNTIVNEVYTTALKAGATAGKVSGAGGGGYMWFFVPLSKRLDVVNALNKFGGTSGNCHFTSNGCQAWTVFQ